MVCLSLLLTVKQFASAEVGPGNGGGNGGNGFLMQEMKAANPGLSAKEIILKAFNDSEGRVPKLHRFENEELFYFSSRHEVDKAKGIMISNYKQEADSIRPTFLCNNLDLGPLLSKVDPPCALYSFKGKQKFKENKIVKTATGLAVQYKLEQDSSLFNVYEFRKLSETEIVFVRHSMEKSGDKYLCYDLFSQSQHPRAYESVDGICSVGYIWQE